MHSKKNLAGRYELSSVLGRSGNAEVYRAIDTLLERDVAVKILLLSVDAINQRFLREAELAARLDHPRIVRVYEAGKSEGISYITMELLDGKTLGDLEGGSLSYRQALTYLIDVLQALEYAHDEGWTHRDVKPSNILTIEGGRHVKLADFGLARRISDLTQTTREGQIAGTIGYLAPERFLSKPADARSDLYSVGIVMYEIFTGTLPFRTDRGDLAATVFSLVHDAPTRPHEINRNVPEPLERVIVRAIDKEPSKRYQSARDFREDLQALLSPTPIVATIRAEGALPMQAPPQLRRAMDKDGSPSRRRDEIYEAVLGGMLATRRRRYREAKDHFLLALTGLSAAGNHLEYAKTEVKYGTMILQKASDGLRERDELREGIAKLNEALEIFRANDLPEQMSETEYLINALERTAVGY